MTSTITTRTTARITARITAVAVAALVSALGLLGLAAPGAQAASVDQIRAISSDNYEGGVIRWINAERTARGLTPVRAQTCTDVLAERWGRHLATNAAFYHQSLDPFFTRCGARYAGETLARGAVTPREMVTMWMNSPGHRAILLSKHPRRIGVGAYLDARGDWVVAADFTRF